MAELLGDPTFYLILIVLVVLSAIVYFEMKFIKRKRVEREEARVKVDDTYNQIVTTRAVSSAIKGQGRNTKEADLAILAADAAYSRGSYAEARAAVERAKGLLREAKMESDPSLHFESMPSTVAEEKAEGCEVPFQETKKLPKNYMESKFMICSVRDEAAEAEREGKDVSLVRDSLKQADEAFASEQYTEALRYALKARKTLRPKEEAEPKKAQDLGAVEKVPATKVVQPNKSSCEKCGTELETGDMFCAKCGVKVERDIRCPRCGNKVKVDDAYCRKCGLPLRSD